MMAARIVPMIVIMAVIWLLVMVMAMAMVGRAQRCT